MSTPEKWILFFFCLALICLLMWFYESCKHGSGAGSPIKQTPTETTPAGYYFIAAIGTRKLANMPQGGGGVCEGYQPCENIITFGEMNPEQREELHKEYIDSLKNRTTFGEMTPEQRKKYHADTD